MKLIKSYLIRNNLQLFLLFLAAYFIIRFFGLMLIPVYLDEAIYINWADMFRKSSNFAYLSMQDGKTPLYFWITGTMMKFLKDPLLSSRLVSLISGGITFSSVYWIGNKIFDKKTVVIFSIIYIFIPYSSFIERMGIADSLFVSLGFLSISLLVYGLNKSILTNKPILSVFFSFFSAISLFFSFLSKSSGKLFLYVIVIWLIFKLIENRKKIVNMLFLFLASGIIYITYTELLRAFKTGAQRFILNIYDKEKLLSVSPKEFIANPIKNLNLGNFDIISNYMIKYLTVPLILAFLVGIFYIFKKTTLNKIYIFLSSIFLFIAIFIVSKIPASRYFLPAIPLFALISAFGINSLVSKVKNLKISGLIVLIIIAPSIIFNLKYTSGKTKDIFTYEDRYYLFEGDLSGIGVEETIKIVLQKLENNNVVLYSDTFWGHPDYIRVKVNRLNKTNNALSIRKNSNFSDNGIVKDILNYPKETKVLLFLTTTRNDINFISKQNNLFLNKQFERYQKKDNQIESAYLFERR